MIKINLLTSIESLKNFLRMRRHETKPDEQAREMTRQVIKKYKKTLKRLSYE